MIELTGLLGCAWQPCHPSPFESFTVLLRLRKFQYSLALVFTKRIKRVLLTLRICSVVCIIFELLLQLTTNYRYHTLTV